MKATELHFPLGSESQSAPACSYPGTVYVIGFFYLLANRQTYLASALAEEQGGGGGCDHERFNKRFVFLWLILFS